MDEETRKTVNEFISEFAKLNLKIVKELNKYNSPDEIECELLKELRENAQTLQNINLL